MVSIAQSDPNAFSGAAIVSLKVFEIGVSAERALSCHFRPRHQRSLRRCLDAV